MGGTGRGEIEEGTGAGSDPQAKGCPQSYFPGAGAAYWVALQ